MHLTVINSTYDIEIWPSKEFDCSWEFFCKQLTKIQIVKAKTDVQLISPVEYFTIEESLDLTESGAVRRCADNIKLWHGVPVDCDGQMTLDEAKARFEKYSYVLYTTFGHQTVNKPYDCFRIFFEIKEPVNNSDFVARKESLQEFIGAHDKTTLAISRSFYLPSCSKENAHLAVFYCNQGIPLDVMELAPTIEIPYVPDENYEEPSPEFRARVLDILSNMHDMDYEDYWKIASAMYNSGYSESEFLEFSKRVRSHRLKTDKPAAQWKLSKRKNIQFGFLVNLCKTRFPGISLSTSTVVKDPALREFNRLIDVNRRNVMNKPIDIPTEY